MKRYIETPLVISLHSCQPPFPEWFGGKASNLLRLTRFGAPVPPGFCISTAAYELFLASFEPDFSSFEALRESILQAPIPARVEHAILSAWRDLTSRFGPRCAVRSSATGEDASAGSHAGMQLTLLNISSEEALSPAIRECWAALHSRNAMLYNLRGGGVTNPNSMAVIIQHLVDAKTAGVVFSRNPVSGHGDEMVINAAWGLGETVVGGGAADTWYVDRESGMVLRSSIAAKTTLLRPSEKGGLEKQPVESAFQRSESLTPAQIAILWRLGREIESAWGEPQDIEWALQDGGFQVLQTRPISAGAGHKRFPRTVWSNVNVGEALPGVATPATWSIIHSFSRRGFEKAFGALGLDVPEDFGLVGSFRGRIYLNLTEFMTIASQLPFLSPEMLLGAGGGRGLEELRGNYEKLSPVQFLLRLPFTLPRLAASQLWNPARAKTWGRTFRAERDRFFSLDLSAMKPEELLRLTRHLTSVFNMNGEIMLECASNALASFIVMTWGLKRAFPDGLLDEQSAVISGLTSVQSAKPGLVLLELAILAKQMPAVAEVLAASDPDDVRGKLETTPAGRKFLRRMDAFMNDFGFRAAREAELSTPRWIENEAVIFSILQRHVEQPKIANPVEIEERRRAARRAATQRLRSEIPAPLRPVFEAALGFTRQSMRLREELRDYVSQSIGMYRKIFLEAGARMHAAGLIDRTDAVFFLTLPEIEAFLSGDLREDVRTRIALRRMEFHAASLLDDPPAGFILGGAPVEESAWTGAAPGGQTLHGLGGSPGQARGTARVIRDLKDASLLRHGEILVTPFTDVGWTPLFLIASGVVTELGGPLSHSCIVAREYGIPAVVNVDNATRVIRTGDELYLDGVRGEVRIVRPCADG
ncbi:MAG: Prodigiosin synthesizing transferase PigC [Myxococcota bacterium]|nr:Prodigiosin synthesizing transferase PigC [Myxococcota bacterium]